MRVPTEKDKFSKREEKDFMRLQEFIQQDAAEEVEEVRLTGMQKQE